MVPPLWGPRFRIPGACRAAPQTIKGPLVQRGLPRQRVRDCIAVVLQNLQIDSTTLDNSSVTATPRHLLLHKGGLSFGTPLVGASFSNPGGMSRSTPNYKRPPCAKGAPASAGEGLFMLSFCRFFCIQSPYFNLIIRPVNKVRRCSLYESTTVRG